MLEISGILFTFERFLSILVFAIYIYDEGKSEFPTEPAMPGIFDNFYVWFFLIIGLVFVLFPFSVRLKER